MAIAAKALRKSLNSPDEKRPFPHGHNDVVNMGSTVIGRLTLEPGWRWSNDVKPTAGTASCQVAHFIYVVSGRLGNRMDSGEEMEIKAGDVAMVPPGHDGWVVGNETCVLLEMAGAAEYAKRK
jgi:mannose-6-phosphate isomerase-like protein (cupin superfamily)